MLRILKTFCCFFFLISSVFAFQVQLENEVVLPGYGQTHAHAPCFAMGDTNGLVVWQSGINAKSCIVGMRVNKAGQPVDALPFVISNATEAQEKPQVAFGNGLFLVTWNDLRNGKDYDVYAARVSPDGTILDGNGLAMAVGARNQCDPAVCAHAGGFYLVWRSFIRDTTSLMYGKYALFSRAIAPEGTLSAVDSIPFANVNSAREVNAGPPVLAAIGQDEAILLFPSVAMFPLPTGANSIRRIQNGKPISANIFGNRSRLGPDMALAFDGANVLMVWSNNYNAGGRGGSVNSGMGLITAANISAPVLSNPYPANEWGQKTKVVWDGYNYIVVWHWRDVKNASTNHTNIKVRFFSANGTAEDTAMKIAGTYDSPAANPALATDGHGRTYIAFERHPATPDIPIKIAIRTLINKPITPQVLSVETLDSSRIQVVFNTAMDKTLAETIGNFTVSGSISVLSATLQSNSKTLVLATSAMQKNADYTLHIANLQDQSVPALALNDTTIAFTCITKLALTSTTPADYVWGTVALGNPVNFDQTKQVFQAVPSNYLGLPYLLTADRDLAKPPTDTAVSFVTNKELWVYVVYDDLQRTAGRAPTWLTSQFTDNNDNITIRYTGNNSDYAYSVYQKKFPAGKVVLGGNNGLTSYSNYFVIIRDPEDSLPDLATEVSLPFALKEGFTCSPNPFTTTATMVLVNRFQDKQATNRITANVYTLQGRRVASLKPQKISIAGSFTRLSYSWNGGKQPNGIYLIRIREGNRTWNGKLVLAK